MISVFRKIFLLNITTRIYARKIMLSDTIRLSSYNSFLGNKMCGVFIKECKKTILIPINMSEDELIANMKRNTRNEIRKGIKLGLGCSLHSDISSFVIFYNKFAEEKSLPTITNDVLSKYGEHLVMSCVHHNGQILCMHASLIDHTEQRALLLYSASRRFDDEFDRTLIGIANRYLHFFDFCTFKESGCLIYDFGGIYTGDKDDAQKGIANFKRGFGGCEYSTVNYYSVGYWMVLKIKVLLEKRKSRS